MASHYANLCPLGEEFDGATSDRREFEVSTHFDRHGLLDRWRQFERQFLSDAL
jgi:hypothetical protein